MEKVVIMPEIEWQVFVQRLEKVEERLEIQSKSAINWITRKQAALLLTCHEQTASRIIKNPLNKITYRQPNRKIEVDLISLSKYLESTGVSHENITKILNKS